MANDTHDDPAVLHLSVAIIGILGIDDECRYPDIQRTRCGRMLALHGMRANLIELVTELQDRAAGEHISGFDETARDRQTARRAVASAIRQGIQPRR